MTAVRFETVDDAIRVVTIDRPARRNAVDGETAAAPRSAFERDDAIRVAILTGAGGHFCGGADLSAIGDPARRNELTRMAAAAGR